MKHMQSLITDFKYAFCLGDFNINFLQTSYRMVQLTDVNKINKYS